MRTPLGAAALLLASTVLWAGCGGSPDGAEECVPAAEACNGVDDDCDGETDEPGASGCAAWYADGDADGYGGASACLCAPAAPYTVSAGGDCDDGSDAVFPGATETCNGLDDDCDTVVDEELAGCCTPTTVQGCGVAQGICVAGTSTCGAGFAWGPCLDGGGAQITLPGTVAESCNGLDDDCDGTTDEEVPEAGAPCDGPDADLCEEGTIACVYGELLCGDVTASNPDLCNALDDDCDAATADGSGDPLLGTSCDGPDADLCKEGTSSCVSGELSCSDSTASNIEPCNGLDDDCNPATADGSGDPLLGTSCDGPDADLCKEGTSSCASGELSCSDSTAGNVETCNGLDDDCDGQADEGFPGLGAPCARGGGLCLRWDVFVCKADQTGIECGAVAGAPSAEECNGLDDDCNGTADDGGLVQGCYTGPDGTLGVGACTAGTMTCSFAAWGGCVGQVTPADERCNGIDDDCDAQVDEGFDVGSSCGVGLSTCGASGVKVCSPFGDATVCGATPGAPGVETCNGMDDDCDAQVDEGIPGCCPSPGNFDLCGTSQGMCDVGTSTCGADRSWGPCVDGGGAPVTLAGQVTESCNGVDDDCDGATDEPGAAGCTDYWTDLDGDGYGVGSPLCLCGPTGRYTATVGGDCDDANGYARPGGWEICDGADNDCDGATDEGLGSYACDGTDADYCTDGAYTCVGGLFTCLEALTIRDELCGNGLDDDCNPETPDTCP